MKINKLLYFAPLMALASCGNGNQATTEPEVKTTDIPTEKSTTDSTTATPLQETKSADNCDVNTTFVTFYKEGNPFHVLTDNNEKDKELALCKSFTKAVTKEGKVVDVKFKGYQAGEDNAGAFVTENYRNEWTGFEFESAYKPNNLYGEEGGFLFNDEYIKNHQVAKEIKTNTDALTAEDKAFIGKQYANLKMTKVVQNHSWEGIRIFSVQFEKTGDKTLALNALVKDGKYYINEDWGVGDEISTWNVDDDGEYNCPDFTVMVANDKSHYDLFYTIGAAESFAVGKFNIKQDSIVPQRIATYYMTVDYVSKRE